MSPLLQVQDLHLDFGGVKAVDGLSFAVDEGDISEERYGSYLSILESLRQGSDDTGR